MGPNSWVVSQDKLVQDCKCLLSKAGGSTPWRISCSEGGASPHPRQFTSHLANSSPFPVHHTEGTQPRHAMRVAQPHAHPWGQSVVQ